MIIGFSCREGSDRAFRKDHRKKVMKFLRNKVFQFLSSFLFTFDVLQVLRFRHFILYPLFSNVCCFFFKSNGLDNERIELSFNPFVGKFMFVSWFSLYKGDNEFIVEVVKIFFDLALNFKHNFINIDLGGFFPPRELLFSPVNFWIGFNKPRITFCIPNAVTKNCVSFCLPLTSRLAVTYSLIEPSWFFVPSTFITAISFYRLRIRRLCSFAKTLSIKIPVAPESMRATVSPFR